MVFGFGKPSGTTADNTTTGVNHNSQVDAHGNPVASSDAHVAGVHVPGTGTNTNTNHQGSGILGGNQIAPGTHNQTFGDRSGVAGADAHHAPGTGAYVAGQHVPGTGNNNTTHYDKHGDAHNSGVAASAANAVKSDSTHYDKHGDAHNSNAAATAANVVKPNSTHHTGSAFPGTNTTTHGSHTGTGLTGAHNTTHYDKHGDAHNSGVAASAANAVKPDSHHTGSGVFGSNTNTYGTHTGTGLNTDHTGLTGTHNSTHYDKHGDAHNTGAAASTANALKSDSTHYDKHGDAHNSGVAASAANALKPNTTHQSGIAGSHTDAYGQHTGTGLTGTHGNTHYDKHGDAHNSGAAATAANALKPNNTHQSGVPGTHHDAYGSNTATGLGNSRTGTGLTGNDNTHYDKHGAPHNSSIAASAANALKPNSSHQTGTGIPGTHQTHGSHTGTDFTGTHGETGYPGSQAGLVSHHDTHATPGFTSGHQDLTHVDHHGATHHSGSVPHAHHVDTRPLSATDYEIARDHTGPHILHDVAPGQTTHTGTVVSPVGSHGAHGVHGSHTGTGLTGTHDGVRTGTGLTGDHNATHFDKHGNAHKSSTGATAANALKPDHKHSGTTAIGSAHDSHATHGTHGHTIAGHGQVDEAKLVEADKLEKKGHTQEKIGNLLHVKSMVGKGQAKVLESETVRAEAAGRTGLNSATTGNTTDRAL